MNGERFWKIANTTMTICSVAVTLIIVPWGTWVTKTIHEMQVEQAHLTEWKAIGPRFTPTDADNLRLRVLTEINEKVENKLSRIELELKKLNETMARHLGEKVITP